MTPVPRHQCLIYEGPPSRHLTMLAAITRQKLQQNHRCLYLNSVPMVAGMRSYLAAVGVDVAYEIEKTSLILSSELDHLADGQHFDVDKLIGKLEAAIYQAVQDGYAGLWVTGDMTWEFGPERDYSKLFEYETRLEQVFRTHPEISGICQYHTDILPRTAVQQGMQTHHTLFVNEPLSLMNPHYKEPETISRNIGTWADVESVLRLTSPEQAS